MRALPAVLLLSLAAAAPSVAPAPSATPATPCEPCHVPGGIYHVHAPPGWNGTTPLPLLVFLHGHRGSGAGILDNPEVTGPADQLGFLLVAPDGAGGDWSHQGAPRQTRDDRSFLRTVVADVRKRLPVTHTIVLGGFSSGGSMVWDMACFAPLGFTAFLPFAGGFWERMPTACTAPVNLRHVHGTADPVAPLAGRSIGERWRLADIHRGFTIWRETDRCQGEPDHRVSAGELDCMVWSCRTRRTLELCLHPGGHEIEGTWLGEGLRWASRLPAQR
ncbi:conserved exported protein of unknown function [Rhodovastum atsumiense]|uniref:Polyhydroxybutyrate depolymerase n=1 Tax=Rhodovastum atsumiense TaxID=504468 RepID=A0A5M6IS58_9PROT|nr:hypothetical protein [Rhodovastum atsumiense]KAA5611134.1 hypothetical protein F1189_16220 [Rhodovastum atsumiense]CAH2599207.1 conserved exported protein of unknown function [Rhodovastum atsumiense]